MFELVHIPLNYTSSIITKSVSYNMNTAMANANKLSILLVSLSQDAAVRYIADLVHGQYLADPSKNISNFNITIHKNVECIYK